MDYVVLIKNPLKTRPFWSLGRVKHIFLGHDGLVRSALVLRGDKVTHKYAIKHLYPLEVSENCKQNDLEVNSNELPEEEDLSVVSETHADNIELLFMTQTKVMTLVMTVQ